MSKAKEVTDWLPGRKQRRLTSTANVANSQAKPDDDAAFAGANGDPRDWTEDGLRQSAIRAGFQGGQASLLKGKAAQNEKAFTELFTEMCFGVLTNTEVNGHSTKHCVHAHEVEGITADYEDQLSGTEVKEGTVLNLQDIARRKLMQDTYNDAYRAAQYTARKLFTSGVKSAPTADAQAQRAMSLMSGKRAMLANMLILAKADLPKAQEHMNPHLRDIVNGKAANVRKLETRGKKIQAAMDVVLSGKHTDWKQLIKDEKSQQKKLDGTREKLEDYRKKQRSGFDLRSVPKDHASRQAFEELMKETLEETNWTKV